VVKLSWSLAIAAIALAAGAATSRPNHAAAARAVSCTKSVVLNFATYGYTNPPTNYTSNAPNRCWGFNCFAQNTSTFTICSRVTGRTIGRGPNRVYDDTNPGLPLATDQTSIRSCAGLPWPDANGGLYAEYMAPRSSTCSSSCWREVSAGHPVKKYYAELYSSRSRVANLFSNWRNSTQPGIGPVGVAGTINISPFIYRYNNGLYHHWTALTNWITILCSATPSGGYLSVYGGGGMAVAGTAEQRIINAMNTCTQH